jgi:hypothetical protein
MRTKATQKGFSLRRPLIRISCRFLFQTDTVCTFSYSLNGKTWHKIDVNGAEYKFKARPGRWIGAKAGLYCNRFHSKNDSGWVEADWFRISR